ncbi:glycosyltransferase [Cellulophaga sp. Z1A5H]|uniref:glycosyltransferase n=1 Tax=Cellulophaga sp. Z1A5H TaxID=2687291 RepID=UPI0013FD7EE1|nr:glycosyltransferase [Cellulophaga sp. Z1A5H]
MEKSIKTAIVYHYAAHYRLGIFQELMQTTDIEYTLISDKGSDNNIKTIDPKYSQLTIKEGGVRWLFVKNRTFIKNKFLYQKGLLSIFRNNDFDGAIFLGNIYYLSTWVCVLYLKLKGKKIYFWTHGVTSNEKGLKWRLRKLFYSLSDKVLLYGENAKEVMVQNGFNENKLIAIYNSLDYDAQVQNRANITQTLISETRKELFTNSELPILFFVGRLTHYKKLDMILDAVKSLNDRGTKINVLFIGDGEAKEALKNLAVKFNLKNYINIFGAVYDEGELCRLVSAADLCVSPGEVGLTAITSLGYGTPVLTHDDFNHQMPEYEAIIPKFNGDLFKRDSVEDLITKIEDWFSSTKDLSREEIRKNCYQVIDEKYNPKYQAELINNCIRTS